MGDSTRHLLSASDLSGEEISFLLDCAAALKRRPLTLAAMRDLCAIPEIDFVISRDEVPLPRLMSEAHAPFDFYKLYACSDALKATTP